MEDDPEQVLEDYIDFLRKAELKLVRDQIKPEEKLPERRKTKLSVPKIKVFDDFGGVESA